MGEIKYRFGYDDEGKIVSIDNLNRNNKNTRTFRCVSCGTILTPKIGNERVPHFSHQRTENCSHESYLHKLSKRVLTQRFNESKEFIIKYCKTTHCSERKSCTYHNEGCVLSKIESINLKEFYNTCQEEQTILGFRSDILLSDSTGKVTDPILIEIKCTHESSSQKLNSGLRIIEITVNSEDDIVTLMNEDIIEDKNRVKFIGFKRESKDTHPLGLLKDISRFVLHPSGEVDIIDSINCLDRDIKQYENSSLELNICSNLWWDVLELGLVKSLDLGYNFKNCLLCKYHDLFDYDQPIICQNHITHKTPKHPNQTYSVQCDHYVIDIERIKTIRKRFSYNVINIVKNNNF